jgi:hypothetical protein
MNINIILGTPINTEAIKLELTKSLNIGELNNKILPILIIIIVTIKVPPIILGISFR